MSYTAICKQWEKEHNKKVKQDQEHSRQLREREETLNSKIILSQILGRIKEEQNRQEIRKIKDNVLLALRENNPFNYPQYLIIWDILNNNFSQVITDYNRERIKKQEIKKAIEYVDKFSTEIVGYYWRERLLSI